jgi:IclR family transcriptional regulator, mhp operon transcriptional activator
MRNSKMEKGVPIRAISRGLSVLRAVNAHGGLTMMEISQTSEVPYPTACRIVQTLLYEGYLERERGRKTYRTTALTRELGQQPDQRGAARPTLSEGLRAAGT